jgi:hypothetical protein
MVRYRNHIDTTCFRSLDKRLLYSGCLPVLSGWTHTRSAAG